MIKLGALWKRQGKKGSFLAGKFGEASIMIFPNTNKDQPNQPDYVIFIAEDNRRQEGKSEPKNFAPTNQAPKNGGWDPEDPGF